MLDQNVNKTLVTCVQLSANPYTTCLEPLNSDSSWWGACTGGLEPESCCCHVTATDVRPGCSALDNCDFTWKELKQLLVTLSHGNWVQVLLTAFKVCVKLNHVTELCTFLSHLDLALLSKNSEAPAPTLDMARKR